MSTGMSSLAIRRRPWELSLRTQISLYRKNSSQLVWAAGTDRSVSRTPNPRQNVTPCKGYCLRETKLQSGGVGASLRECQVGVARKFRRHGFAAAQKIGLLGETELVPDALETSRPQLADYGLERQIVKAPAAGFPLEPAAVAPDAPAFLEETKRPAREKHAAQRSPGHARPRRLRHIDRENEPPAWP